MPSLRRAVSETLLVLFDSSITYRTRYQRHQDIPALLDLIVNDETNPRAFRCILQELAREIGHLPNGEALLGNSHGLRSGRGGDPSTS